MSRRILVGFTGGIRSSVLIALLREQDCEMRGVFLDFSDFQHGAWRSVHESVGSPEAARHAAARASELGLELEIISAGGLFEQRVADPYLHEVLRGQEPSPEVLLHSELLLSALRQLGRDGNYDGVATGHRGILRGGVLLADATDHCQASTLAFACGSETRDLDFPLGGFNDAQIFKLAQTLGLPPDPARLQRIQHPSVAAPSAWFEWASARLPPGFSQPGWVREIHQGSGLAEHQGVHEHPIGVPVHVALIEDEPNSATSAPSERLYSIAADAESQTIWAGTLQAYAQQSVLLRDFRWLDPVGAPPLAGLQVEVRRADGHWVRSAAHLWAGEAATARLEFALPAAGILNGSHLAFVREGRIVGTARANLPFKSPLGAGK